MFNKSVGSGRPTKIKYLTDIDTNSLSVFGIKIYVICIYNDCFQ